MEVDCRHFVVDSRAKGVPAGSLLSPASLATQQPAAPSVMGELLPAVGLPVRSPDRRLALGRRRRSVDVSARGFASRASSGREMTRSSKKPLSQPATARWWLFSAQSSNASRETRQLWRSFHVIAHRPTGDTVGPPLVGSTKSRGVSDYSAESAAAGSCPNRSVSRLMLQRLRQATACS